MGQLPRWLVILFAIGLTLLTGMLCTSLLMHGVYMLQDPEILRDGQYVFVFFLGGGAGLLIAVPSAVIGAVMLARCPDFMRYLGITLASLTALGVASGLALCLPAGANAVAWGVMGIGITLFGVIWAPLALLSFAYVAPVAVPVGVVMALAVAGAYWLYCRREGGTASV